MSSLESWLLRDHVFIGPCGEPENAADLEKTLRLGRPRSQEDQDVDIRQISRFARRRRLVE